MTNIQEPKQMEYAFYGIRRILHSFSIFMLVLVGMLFCSRFLFLPKLTRVQVAGEDRNIQEVRDYHAKLTAQLLEAETQRMQLLLPVQDDRYRSLITVKHRAFSFEDIRDRFKNVAQQFADGEVQTVFFGEITLHDVQVLDVSGEVRNVGQRSMTVLAQFIEALRMLPIVSEVQNTRFTRSFTEEKGDFSPFTLNVILQ